MKKENCMRRTRTKSKLLTVRVDMQQFGWIKAEKLSASAIFQEALRELGYKGER